MTCASVLIDGGHLRVQATQAGQAYSPDFIEKVAHSCVRSDESLLRVLYYDCAPDVGYGASRRAEIQGLQAAKNSACDCAADFKPIFEQKGVDMRTGLDIVNFAAKNSVDRIILITADTDCLPAMKHARTAGLQIVLVSLPNGRPAQELLWHSDFRRPISWLPT